MIYTYLELKEMKEAGIKLEWEKISKEQLESLFITEELPNSFIADLYDVNPSKVKYKRNKWGIVMYSAKYMYQKFKEENEDLFRILNRDSKDRVLKMENVDSYAKAITHYAFRNGPVEEMHVNGKLSQEDMKTLNKYMVNKVATLLSLMVKGDWLKLELLLDYMASHYGTNWDEAEVDYEDVEMIFRNFLENTVMDDDRCKNSMVGC